MSIWIARDMDGELWLSVVKPKRLEKSFGHGSGYIIPKHHYPEVTWENSPKELVVKGNKIRKENNMTREKAIKTIKAWDFLNNDEKDVLKTLIPELVESEDERIKKDIISHLQYEYVVKKNVSDVEYDKWIAWLEKQGNITKLSEEEQNKFAKGVLTSCALSFIDYLDAHKYEGKMCVSNGECEDIENAFHNAMWDRLHRYYCKYIEKQGEKEEANGFDAELNALLKKYEHLSKEELQEPLEFYLGVVRDDLDIVREEKPKWTEEDECYMGECISAVATKDGWSFEEKRKTKHWLKSIKQRIG